jgi:hypothetical protein
MVAFELARYFESSGNTADAGRWYLTAAERFRRADWKTKAQEGATRLGATEPAEIPEPPPRSKASEAVPAEASAEAVSPEPSSVSQASLGESSARPESLASPRTEPNRQRRGRRGGRDARPSRRGMQHSSTRAVDSSAVSTSRAAPEERPTSSSEVELAEATPEAAPPPSLRGRYGDPGLASRLTQLEMNFRRLLACTPVTLDEADKAPAGPGVWVLTDSDLTSYYYVEACQTLRVAIPNLLRSGAGRRGESIRPGLAEHLGIPESRVSKYLADHCVVRWLQMDDDAPYFAHFLIAVLHPALNE